MAIFAKKIEMPSIVPLLQKTYEHSPEMQRLASEQKKQILFHLADQLEHQSEMVLKANERDLQNMSPDNPKRDRLLLNKERIANLATSLREVANLEDPTRKLLSETVLDNGLKVQKISVPLGVVGIIYEARPNVTIDVAALCIRSGNACVLRGGTDAEHSNIALVKLIHEVLEEYSLSTDLVQLLPVDRAFVMELLQANKYVDIIIPRGSQGLIDFVRTNSKVPTIETGAGVCHTYVHGSADLEKAAKVVVNAKVSRPSVCNSLDTIVVDESVAAEFLPKIVDGMAEYGVGIYADEPSKAILDAAQYEYSHAAKEDSFGQEYLSFRCSVKTVKDYDEAVAHIRKYSSRHSEAIMAENQEVCEQFLAEIDAAAVYANASTRFTDGGVFGLGAEIGISTQKLHARGPFALEKLTTEKWIVRGEGQTR